METLNLIVSLAVLVFVVLNALWIGRKLFEVEGRIIDKVKDVVRSESKRA